MGDPTVAELLSIPDPDAAAFNPANGVRRSMRTVKSRVLEPGFIDHGAQKAENLTEDVHPIATEAKSTAAKRLRSAVDLHVKPTTSGRTKAPEPLTPVESEGTGLESPLKKSKLTDTPTSSSTLTKSNVEVQEDESMAGETDGEFVPTALATVGAPKTPQPRTSPAFLASPPSSDESQTPSPKKRGIPAAVRPRRTVRKIVTAKSPKTAYKTVDPVSESIVVRPPPHGKPLVWAEGRQALCETLPYYRAYQSGAYTHDNLSFGFLLDRDCGERAYMDEEVVITRAGGGCSANEDGDMRQSEDQRSSATTVKNFLNNKKYGVPVALIVGKQNKNCPSTVPYEYCVMDWFQVTDVWPERSHGKKCFKFRFEKIDLATKSWWAAEGTPDPPKVRDFSIKAVYEDCDTCGEESPQVFEDGWICLNENCSKFWLIDGVEAPAELSYDDRFLRERTPWPGNIKPPFSLKPALLEADIGNDAGYAVSRVCWKGMACPKCGRCNSREHWNEWRCQTKNCGFTYNVKQSVLSPRAVLEVHEVEWVGHALPQDTFTTPVTEQVTFMDNWRIHTYDILPGNVITHFSANSTINKRPGGPHDMFIDLQGADMGLQRFPLKNSGLRGPMLTNHFAVNFGMPYKYIVDVDSKPFSEAPKPIINALHRLTWAGRKTVSDDTFQPFNELLTLGYFEQQKIGFHDDGESTLGPTVATLSLGGQAKMMIRMKATYYSGKSKAGKYDPLAPVLPGCKGYDERIKLNSLYGKISEAAFEKAKLEMYQKIGRIGTPPVLLTMQLNHGDMVVMHGAEMQRYYEHSVIPSGKLRFALTCRFVRPELVDSSQHWKGDYVVEPGTVTDYDGDEVQMSDATPPAVHSYEDWTMVDVPSPGAV